MGTKKLPHPYAAAIQDINERRKPGTFQTSASAVSRIINSTDYEMFAKEGRIKVTSRDVAWSVSPQLAAQIPNYPVVYAAGPALRKEVMDLLRVQKFRIVAHGKNWISVVGRRV